MATYASATTNPFIKPGNGDTKGACNSGKQETVGAAKNAPGMARLQSKRERKRAKRRQQENLLLDVDEKAEQAAADLRNGSTEQALEVLADDTKSIADEEGGAVCAVRLDDNDNLLIEDSCCSAAIDGAQTDESAAGREDDARQTSSAAEDSQAPSGPIDLTAAIDLTEISLDSPSKLSNGVCVAEGLVAGMETNEEAIGLQNHHANKRMEDRAKLGGQDSLEEEDDEEEEEEGDGPNARAEDEEDQEDRAPMERDSRRHQHIELIKKLRLQLRDLERYAYERGELDQVPASMMAERQTVILDSLKRKLPLNIDEDRLEKLELEELKSQVDREIGELIDPLITKDNQLNQLKTQLIDLERYVSHLHKTLGKSFEKRAADGDCSCKIHGCSTPSPRNSSSAVTFQSLAGTTDASDDATANGSRLAHDEQTSSSLMDNETLPKTSRLIRSLMAQLICSDVKIQEAMKMEKDYSRRYPGNAVQCSERKSSQDSNCSQAAPTIKAPQFHDTTVWNMHLDRVLLATDSLTNLFNVEPAAVASGERKKMGPAAMAANVDESLVDSVVRRQLVPALRDLLAYGLIDPNTLPRPTYRSLLFDPYNLITALTCLPGSQSQQQQQQQQQQDATSLAAQDKIHVWHVIEDYFNSHNEPEFRSSSVKTLSQSFNLTPSLNGPIKVTSKQGLLIALDDIIERLARCRPNGPESHFKLFVYSALNHSKLATWIRIVFRNKSIMRKFYHNFSFVCQPDKMDKFLQVTDALNQIEFKLNTDTGSAEQFVSAF